MWQCYAIYTCNNIMLNECTKMKKWESVEYEVWTSLTQQH